MGTDEIALKESRIIKFSSPNSDGDKPKREIIYLKYLEEKGWLYSSSEDNFESLSKAKIYKLGPYSDNLLGQLINKDYNGGIFIVYNYERPDRLLLYKNNSGVYSTSLDYSSFSSNAKGNLP